MTASVNEKQRTVVSSEPWPAKGISEYYNLRCGDWGTLIFYSDNTFDFDPTNVPNDDAIIERWGATILKNSLIGNWTFKIHGLAIPTQILEHDGHYFIGCSLESSAVVRESDQVWNTEGEAISALLKDEWIEAADHVYVRPPTDR